MPLYDTFSYIVCCAFPCTLLDPFCIRQVCNIFNGVKSKPFLWNGGLKFIFITDR